MKPYHFFIFITFTFVLIACDNQEKTCQFGSPQAIFSQKLEKVEQHEFTANQQEAKERAVFENGLDLEIFQSGCDTIRQVFQSTFTEDLSQENANFFIEMAIQQFFYLGSVSSDHFTLNYLGQTIQDQFHDIKLGQALELQPNYFIKIDKITGKTETVLIVELMSNI
ncbi:MAG: hypothetical protein AAF985_19435 [Bacteroidota bacterium]